MTLPRLSRLFAAAALPLVAGCHTADNDRIVIGRDVLMPGFAPSPSEAPLPDAAPSLVSLERTNWEPTRIVVPFDGVTHGPLYAKPTRCTVSTARQRDEFPTIETSLELDGSTNNQQVREVVRNFAIVVADALLLPFRFFVRPPSVEQTSPRWLYERGWPGRTPEPEVVPIERDRPEFAAEPEPGPS